MVSAPRRGLLEETSEVGSAIGRNQPCPCGSGSKYKKCCLRRARSEEQARQVSRRGVGLALAWLLDRYPEEIDEAVQEQFFGSLSAEARERLQNLDTGLLAMVDSNSMEWLLAEGSLSVDGREVKVLDLILGQEGPLLEVEQRAYLEELGRRPLRLYEVRDSRPGQGMTLQDARGPEASPVAVLEREGSKSLGKGDVIAARVLHRDPPELSGAVYDCTGFQLRVHDVLDKLEEGSGADSGSIALAIVDAWLDRLTAPPPRLVDAAGDPLTLVTDHYRILDREALELTLESQDDVSGDSERGWARLEEPDATMSRSLVAINPGKRRDRLELFTRSLRLADEGKTWFQQVAGESVAFVIREIVDPLAAMESPPTPGHESAPGPEMTPGLRQELTRHLYGNWEDEPIPALDGLTPRQAVATEAGRKKTIRLLRSYEADERRAARRTGAEALDLGFLWEAVGLTREN